MRRAVRLPALLQYRPLTTARALSTTSRSTPTLPSSPPLPPQPSRLLSTRPPTRVMGVEKQTQQEGNGPKPKKGQKITVDCTGYLADGMRKFWSTADPGQQPFTFTVGMGQVIRGWDEGFMQMSLGEKARLTMTDGAGGFPAWNIPPNATLVFDVAIRSIQ